MNHQCVIALTGHQVLPYVAKCGCGWVSDPYPHTDPAGTAATAHCRERNN